MFRLAALFPPRRRVGVGVATALVMTALIAGSLLPFRDNLSGSAAGLAFIVPVVVATAVGGAVAAVVAVCAGFVAYNALFTTPYLTLAVADPGDVIGLVVFVVVGAVTAMIVTLRQREAEAARRREKEALALYELSRSFVEGDLQVALDATVEAVRDLFAAASVAIVTALLDDDLEVIAEAGSPLPDSILQRLRAAERYDWSGRLPLDEHVVPLLAGARSVGFLVVVGDVPEPGLRLLSVFANNVALALHRAELAAEATRVEVLEETDRVRSALIRSVSHDLRTPLASIIAAGEDLAEEELDLSPADRRLLADTVAEEGQRLNRLVTNLLDLSRIESGRLELRREAVELRELVDGALAGRGLAVTVELDDGLPPLWVDPLLIEQVLRNLVENAERHAGSIPEVVVRGRCEDRMAVVDVEDRGPGVPDTLKERIFVPFHQVGGGSRPSHSGVGLAICKAYVEAHDGAIDVVDTPGGGATFRVTVPLARVPSGEPSQ